MPNLFATSNTASSFLTESDIQFLKTSASSEELNTKDCLILFDVDGPLNKSGLFKDLLRLTTENYKPLINETNSDALDRLMKVGKDLFVDSSKQYDNNGHVTRTLEYLMNPNTGVPGSISKYSTEATEIELHRRLHKELLEINPDFNGKVIFPVTEQTLFDMGRSITMHSRFVEEFCDLALNFEKKSGGARQHVVLMSCGWQVILQGIADRINEHMFTLREQNGQPRGEPLVSTVKSGQVWKFTPEDGGVHQNAPTFNEESKVVLSDEYISSNQIDNRNVIFVFDGETDCELAKSVHNKKGIILQVHEVDDPVYLKKVEAFLDKKAPDRMFNRSVEVNWKKNGELLQAMQWWSEDRALGISTKPPQNLVKASPSLDVARSATETARASNPTSEPSLNSNSLSLPTMSLSAS